MEYSHYDQDSKCELKFRTPDSKNLKIILIDLYFLGDEDDPELRKTIAVPLRDFKIITKYLTKEFEETNN